MERTLASIREISGHGYRSTFVLTQNVHDLVYEGNPQGNRAVGFPVALASELSQGGRTCALYTLSQGFRLFRDSQRILSETDVAAQQFIERTGLGDMLNMGYGSPGQMNDMVRLPADVLPGLYPWLRHDANTLVVDGGDYLVDTGHNVHGATFGDRAVLELLESWARDPELKGRPTVVFLCPQLGDVPRDLISGDGVFGLVRVEYPDRSERHDFLRAMGVEGGRLEILANQTTGFRRVDLHEAVVRGFDDEGVAKRKAEIIVARCGDTVELVEARFGLDISNAQPHVKAYLQDLMGVMRTSPQSPGVPRGILFVGVPGNGKSHLAQAFAHDCGMNMLRFKNIRSMWVGESERNLETVLDLLPSLAPCVVFVDEIDQMLGSRAWAAGTDAGSRVEARLLGRLLDFMGDSQHRGEIIWIGATNRPDLLDIAALRRFDRIFPFMNPTAGARAELIRDIATRTEIPLATEFDFPGASAVMDEFSCDEVEKVMRRAYEIATRAETTGVTVQHVTTARSAFKHNYNPLMQELVALLSIQAANFLSDLPWFDEAGKLRSDVERPPFLDRFLDESGGLRNLQIAQRVAELQQQARWA